MAYTQEQIDIKFEAICTMIERKGYSLRQCLKEKNTPGSETFYKWMDSDKTEEKQKRYMRACEEREDGIFEEILEIANTPVEGVTQKLNAKGKVTEETKGDMIGHRKLQIDTRKWMLGKLNPTKFGDRQIQQHEGKITNRIEVSDEDAKKISDALDDEY